MSMDEAQAWLYLAMPKPRGLPPNTTRGQGAAAGSRGHPLAQALGAEKGKRFCTNFLLCPAQNGQPVPISCMSKRKNTRKFLLLPSERETLAKCLERKKRPDPSEATKKRVPQILMLGTWWGRELPRRDAGGREKCSPWPSLGPLCHLPATRGCHPRARSPGLSLLQRSARAPRALRSRLRAAGKVSS